MLASHLISGDSPSVSLIVLCTLVWLSPQKNQLLLGGPEEVY